MSKSVRKILASVLMLLMLAGAMPLVSSAAPKDAPKIDNLAANATVKIGYRSTKTFTADKDVYWALSGNANVKKGAETDNSITIQAAKGSRRQGATLIATARGGDPDIDVTEVNIEVSTAWWQWLIVIFLLGFIWY